ncbi:unnamed protein product, partial [Trichobilharzia szidati]
MACKEKPSKSILKSDQEQPPTLGTYNIYTKRASFKDDVILQQFIQDNCEVITPPVIEAKLPIASDDTEEQLSPEEISRRNEFKQKRRLVDLEGIDGLNLKAVLGHRVSLPGVELDEDDDDDGDNENNKRKEAVSQASGSVCTSGEVSLPVPSKSNEHESDSDWSFPDTESNSLCYPVPNVVNRLPDTSSTAGTTTTTTTNTVRIVKI